MDEKNSKKGYIIVTADTKLNPDIPSPVKIFYSDLVSLSRQYGYCWSSNDYFCKKYNVNRSTVAKWISMLKKQFFIETSYGQRYSIKKKRYVKQRKIYITELQKEKDMNKYERPSFIKIPLSVVENTNITANAKLLYGEIDALCYQRGFCFASNDYFSELYNTSIISVSNWISSLINEGFVTAKYVTMFNNKLNKTVNGRKIFLVENDDKKDLKENFNIKANHTRLDRDLKANNTCINIEDYKSNSKEEIVTQSSFYSKKNLEVTITTSEEVDLFTPNGVECKEELKPITTTKQKPITTTKEKIIFPTKKKPAIMSTASYKLIEKLILDTDLFFNHRLPTEKNDYKITNTIKKAVEYLDYLSAGLFIKKLSFSDDYLKQYEGKTLIPNQPLVFSEVDDLITYAIDNWKLYLTIGYMPENKEGLKKVSIDNWLYNVHTGFSWFLECLNKPAKEIKRYTANQLLDEVPEEFADKFLDLYRSIQMDDDEKSQFYRYIYFLYKRWENITEWYDGFLTRSGYRNYISHPAVFAQTLKTFLTYYTHWENWRHLKPNSALWRDFRKHCLKEYNVDINPNKEWLDKAIIEEKEDAERTAMARRNEELKLKVEQERENQEELEKMFG